MPALPPITTTVCPRSSLIAGRTSHARATTDGAAGDLGAERLERGDVISEKVGNGWMVSREHVERDPGPDRERGLLQPLAGLRARARTRRSSRSPSLSRVRNPFDSA